MTFVGLLWQGDQESIYCGAQPYRTRLIVQVCLHIPAPASQPRRKRAYTGRFQPLPRPIAALPNR
jgi:hypothetical protein